MEQDEKSLPAPAFILYLRHILGFNGITDVTFVQAGGTMRVAQGQVSAEEFLAPLLKQIKAAV